MAFIIQVVNTQLSEFKSLRLSLAVDITRYGSELNIFMEGAKLA
jgi:hypothetical protein